MPHTSEASMRAIGYKDRTGWPKGVPRQFVQLIIDCPDRVYGTWWYVNAEDSRIPIEGWYLWIASQNRLGITRSNKVWWTTVDNLEAALQAWPVFELAQEKPRKARQPKGKPRPAIQVNEDAAHRPAPLPTLAFSLSHGEKRWRATPT